jgi:hypothetical protein
VIAHVLRIRVNAIATAAGGVAALVLLPWMFLTPAALIAVAPRCYGRTRNEQGSSDEKGGAVTFHLRFA